MPVESKILHVSVPEAVEGTAPAGVTQFGPVRIPVEHEYVVVDVARIVEGVDVAQRFEPGVLMLSSVIPVGHE